MDKMYMKNYGMWLGGALVLSFIISYVFYFPYLNFLFIIAGTIMGTVKTHQELGGPISFKNAIGPVMLIIGGFQIISLVVTIATWGTEYLEWMLQTVLIGLLMSLLIGISVLLATGAWYMFEKAGKPGWAILVPIYNLIVMCEIAKKPTWWVALFLIPIANIIFLIMMLNGISKAFGKTEGFTVGLVFLRQIFFAILGYGPAQYQFEAVKVNDQLLDN